MKIARVRVDGTSTYALVSQDTVFTKPALERALQLSLPETVDAFGHLLLTRADLTLRIMKAAKGTSSRAPPRRLEQVALLAPLGARPKVIGVGLNYRDHAEEQGVRPPKEPVIFLKPYTAIIGPCDAVQYPPGVTQLDYEGELGVVIGRQCRRANSMEAFDYVLGYTVFNDITARDLQSGDGQWTRGKSFDTFAPTGPWIVTKEEIPDPHALTLMTRVNGEMRQRSNTRNMIFKIPDLVSFVSKVMTLDPGDIIATGTPAGVGIFAKPRPRLLKVGEVVEVEVEKIGRLRNPISVGL